MRTLFLLILLSSLASCSQESPRVLEWTAFDNSFKFDKIPGVKFQTLYFADNKTGSYSHHQHIIYNKGVVYAVWDNHIQDENGSGQRTLYRYSKDEGKSWSDLLELFPSFDEFVPLQTRYMESLYVQSSGYAYAGERLFYIAAVNEWRGDKVASRKKHTFGRIIREIRPDATLGPIMWATENPPEPRPGFEKYALAPKSLVDSLKAYVAQPGCELQLAYTGNQPSVDNHGMGEPTISWETQYGFWVRMFRDSGLKSSKSFEEKERSKTRHNYVAYSYDNGKTWTRPVVSSFPDACARTNVGRLPNGNVYVINNLLPLSTKYGGRSMLALSLSQDGLIFDRAYMLRFVAPEKRFEGKSKSIGYQYPHSVVVGDKLLVLYSVNKEDVELATIPIKSLEK